jgi:hypothetical protein
MGEVYRARDTRLDRNVAVKISAEQFTDRFAREAKVISSLNHPRICTLHDIGPNYLVMELVEGETLADRIARGPIPLEEALPLARQIVEGLEAAHEKGVIHRDLKPANVKITPDGDIKVLDFGLAKVSESAASAQASSDPAASPTMTIQATRAGIILGTAAYMPPEQARGLPVDRRADTWAFGCVFYEMLSGKRLFTGDSTTDVLAAVVRADPDWSALPANAPLPIRRLLKRCLEKDRKRRLPDIGVARLEIDDAMLATPEPPPAAAVTAVRRSRSPMLLGAIVLLTASAAIWFITRPAAQEVWTGTMIGGARSAFHPRLSPDGQLMAFLSFEEQLPQLAVMKADGGSWTVLTHDRDRGYLATAAWAPDGSKIYFDRLFGQPLGVYSIPPLGGEPKLLLDEAFAPEPLRDGSLIVLKLADRGDMQLFHFFPDSGKFDPLPAYMPQIDITALVRAFPDGKQVVYYGMSEAQRSQNPRFLILDLSTRQTRELTSTVSLRQDNQWAPLEVSADGASVYTVTRQHDTNVLMQIPVGGGRPRPILSFAATARATSMDVARDGALYLDQEILTSSILSLPEMGGAMQELALPANSSSMFMPDGSTVVVLSDNGKSRLDIFRPGSGMQNVLELSEMCGLPAVTFSGYIAFQIGSSNEQRIALAGLRDGRVIRRYKHRSDNGMSASPDGKTLYYSFDGGIWAQPVEGGEPQRITDGIDVAADPSGRYLYLKRAAKNTLRIVRVPAGGGAAEELPPVPPQYRVANPALSPAAVDARGRIVMPVLSVNSFFYRTAVVDPAAKTFTIAPFTIDGDAESPGWAPDGRILARGQRYMLSLWRYQRSAAFK